MPRAENSPGRLTQLDFDALATGAGDAQAEHGTERTGVAVQLPAMQPFNGTRHKYVLMPGGFQYTLDATIAEPSLDAAGVPGGQAERQPTYGQPADGQVQPGQTPQRPLDALAELPSEVAGSVAAGQYAGNGAGRVRLDEPEPGIQPSRDFRITEAHGVGAGGLHEKANANIAAIRLVKTLEEANRDATNEEKAILVRYSGWGALAGVFEYDFRRRPEWNTVATDLEQLLTTEEYESARATTPNAHFTSPLVIQAIWHGLEKLGLRHGVEVLEPAMGIGHFFGCMPETLQGGHRTGVELDSITARIAQKLYPDTTIFAQGFEDVPLPDNYFDAVVGNVPFGDYAVHDPHTRHSLTRSIHDYFFAKSLEKTRPGGIMALITSRYTMDKL